MRVTLLALMTVFRIGFALNPIHESSYNLIPSGNFESATTLSVGAYVRSQNTSVWYVPVALAMRVAPRVELGARIQTEVGDAQRFDGLLLGRHDALEARVARLGDLLGHRDHGRQ